MATAAATPLPTTLPIALPGWIERRPPRGRLTALPDLDPPFDTTDLCEACGAYEWASILSGKPSQAVWSSFAQRHMYNLDGADGGGAPFYRVSMPAIPATAPALSSGVPASTLVLACPLCRLWCDAHRRVYPNGEPSEKARDHADRFYRDCWFTYYVFDYTYFRQTRGGNLRNIEDGEQVAETRQKAMISLRLRFLGNESADAFECLLELTCVDDDLPEGYRQRGGRLLPDGCIDESVLRGWLERCEEGDRDAIGRVSVEPKQDDSDSEKRKHGEACSASIGQEEVQAVAKTMKLRLLDVNTLTVVVRGFDDRYCALSYVWGTVDQFKAAPRHFRPDLDRPGELMLDLDAVISASVSSRGWTGLFAGRKQTKVLGRTITDAIAVTRRLGIPYLWVDSLCILQNDTELEATIPNMHLIYKMAVLTIVGAAGADCDAGLPRSHPRARQITQIRQKVGGRTFMLAQPSLDLILPHTAWSTRAWTFQEGRLPARLLIFTDVGVYFRCRSDTWAEDSPMTVKAQPARQGTQLFGGVEVPIEAAFADYTYNVQRYTRRRLTCQSDALAAFSGFVSEIRRVSIKTDFHWGLPRAHFDAALLWKASSLWSWHKWAYRPSKDDQAADDHDSSSCGEEDCPWQARRERARFPLEEGFRWANEHYPQPEFARLKRRPGLPSWSWCGWQGECGYFPRKARQPELHLLDAIESLVEWPWGERCAEFEQGWEEALQKHGVLTFRAMTATVDFAKLPFGRIGEAPRRAWRGWPMDGGPPLREGVVECVLLSRQRRHPVNHTNHYDSHHRTLDPVKDPWEKEPPCCLVNVMVLSKPADKLGTRGRRGIGMMREDIWASFEPTRQVVRLR